MLNSKKWYEGRQRTNTDQMKAKHSRAHMRLGDSQVPTSPRGGKCIDPWGHSIDTENGHKLLTVKLSHE